MIIGTKDAAKIAGFSQSHIRRLIRQGKLKATKLGHDYMIDDKHIKTIKRRRRNPDQLHDSI